MTRARMQTAIAQVPAAARMLVAAFALLFAGSAAALDVSQSALDFLVDRVVAQTGGRLKVEGAQGSPLSKMRFARLTWQGESGTVVAEDVVIEWSPRALLRAEVDVRTLSARRIALALRPTSSGSTEPPTDLALPLRVTLASVAVHELAWKTGPRSGSVTDIAFAYRGSRDEHALERLRLTSAYGALSGNATLGAAAPLPVSGTLRVQGAGTLAGVAVDATLGGTLAALDVTARGNLRSAPLAAHVALTPFAAAPLKGADVALQRLDLAEFRAGLPSTTLDLAAKVEPESAGFTGTAQLTNQRPGAIDAGALPFARLAATYRWQPDLLELSGMELVPAGGGRVSGTARIPLGDAAGASTWTLAVAGVDPGAIHTRLLHTRVEGRIGATATAKQQIVAGTLSDGRSTASFGATVTPDRVDVSGVRLTSGDAVVSGKGSLGLTGKRAYRAELALTRFDPSRFAAVPAASLDGTMNVSGTLEPAWTAQGDVVIAEGSRYDDLPLTAQLHGALAWPRIHDLRAEVAWGGTHVTANGNAGEVGDALAFSASSDRLADLARLMPADAPLPVAGSITAQGVLRVEPGGIGGNGTLRASGLRLRDGTAAATLALDATLQPGGSARGAVPVAMRRFDVSLRGESLALREQSIERIALEAHGTLAQHTLALDGAAEGHALTLRASGSATPGATLVATTWRGTIDTLDLGGTPALHLAAPARVALARDDVRIDDAHVTVAQGRVDVARFAWAAGRIDTQGAFSGIDLTAVLAIAGRPVPIASTLVLGGDWSVRAAPRLDGEIVVRRERGDLFAAAPADAAPDGSVGFGISTLEARVTLRDDALDASAVMRSVLAGDAQASVAIAAVPGAPPGRIDARAPLTGRLEAHLASLTPLQPFLGTALAVRGRADAALAARGTVGAPQLSGTLAADDLVIDAPRYGVHLTNGRLASRLADERLHVDTLSLEGGNGRFTANGVLALPGSGVDSRLEWRAETFRVANLPELRLVVAGNGTIALTDKRLALQGELRVEDGHVEYEASPPGKLGADVVVQGWPTRAEQEHSTTPPLALDLSVDLGQRLTFTGEGLDAALTGRVRVTTGPDGALRGRGTIRTVYGTYYAFGQRLTIDRGRLIFDGPLENPALDVVALRKNLPVEAGVEVTGTVQVPLVRITSNPPVSENEALSWLITGQGLSGATAAGNSLGLLSAASGALLGSKGKPLTTRIAEEIGLTDISVQQSGTASPTTNGTSSNPLAGQVVVFGKRISDRLTIGYEQGLSLASGALRLEYALTRMLTVRAEAGAVSGLTLVYRRLFR